MSPTIDLTAVAVALIGFGTVVVSGYVAIRLRQIEARCGEHSRRAGASASRAETAANGAAKPKRRRGRGKGHPCG